MHRFRFTTWTKSNYRYAFEVEPLSLLLLLLLPPVPDLRLQSCCYNRLLETQRPRSRLHIRRELASEKEEAAENDIGVYSWESPGVRLRAQVAARYWLCIRISWVHPV